MSKTVNRPQINTQLSYLSECNLPDDLSDKEVYLKALEIFSTLLDMDEIVSNSPVFKHKFSKLNFEISFCDDEMIRDINASYRKKDQSTDVITFALFCDDKNSVIADDTVELGEIIISVDTLTRQSEENNNTIKTELYTLITHGILHLLGFDHLEQKDYDFVVDIQNKVIQKI